MPNGCEVFFEGHSDNSSPAYAPNLDGEGNGVAPIGDAGNTGNIHVDVNSDVNADVDDDDEGDDGTIRLRQEDSIAKWLVSLPVVDQKSILESLYRHNKNCMRLIDQNMWSAIGIGTMYCLENQDTCTILLVVNNIDDVMLETLFNDIHPIDTNVVVQGDSLVCCINNQSNELHYRCTKSGDCTIRKLCNTRDCECIAEKNKILCGQCYKGKRTDDDVHGEDMVIREQLARNILSLAPPQIEEVHGIIQNTCDDSTIGHSKYGNIVINLDEIPDQVVDLLLSKTTNTLQAESIQYLVGRRLGIASFDDRKEVAYFKIRLRSNELKLEFYHHPTDGTIGKRSTQQKAKTNGQANIDVPKPKVTTTAKDYDLSERIKHTFPKSLRDHQTKMISEEARQNTAQATLRCVMGIRDEGLRKKVLDDLREKARLSDDSIVEAKDVKNVFYAVVPPHKMIKVDCPTEKLLFEAFTAEGGEELLAIAETNTLPYTVQARFAGSKFTIVIHDIERFIPTLAKLWGYTAINLFQDDLRRADFAVIKDGNTMYITNNSLTSDPESVLVGSSPAALTKELKSLRKKEKNRIKKENKMEAEILDLKQGCIPISYPPKKYLGIRYFLGIGCTY